MSAVKEYPICKHCGSEDVTKDAIVRWDHDIQDWLFSNDLDHTDCNDCGGECSIKWIKGDPPALTPTPATPFVPTGIIK